MHDSEFNDDKENFFGKRACSAFKMTQWVVVTRNGPKPNSSPCIWQPTLQTALLLSFGLCCCWAQTAHPHARPKTHVNKYLSMVKISFEMEWHVGGCDPHVQKLITWWWTAGWSSCFTAKSAKLGRQMDGWRWLGGSSTLIKHTA